MHYRWYPSMPCSRGGSGPRFHGAGVWSQGGACSQGRGALVPGECLLLGGGGWCEDPPPWQQLLRAVRILLECSFVLLYFPHSTWVTYWFLLNVKYLNNPPFFISERTTRSSRRTLRWWTRTECCDSTGCLAPRPEGTSVRHPTPWVPSLPLPRSIYEEVTMMRYLLHHISSYMKRSRTDACDSSITWNIRHLKIKWISYCFNCFGSHSAGFWIQCLWNELPRDIT